MATIDLTLDGLKVPAIDGYTPPFGTKITRTESNKGGLSTLEVNNNVMLPFAMMRPKTVIEDSLTTNVEYDAKVLFSSSLQAATTLSIGNGTYEGCEVLVKNLSTYTCTVDHGAWSVDIPAGGYVKIEWNGSAWSADVSAAVQAAIASAIDLVLVDYSTTEQPLNIKWIDGKMLYAKVWTGLDINIPNTSWLDITSIVGVDFDYIESARAISHYSSTITGFASLQVELQDSGQKTVVISPGTLANHTDTLIFIYTKASDPTT